MLAICALLLAIAAPCALLPALCSLRSLLPAVAALTSPLLECGQLGIATECLTWVRRHKIGPSKYLHARPKAFKLSMSLAFSVQVTLGYFLMLAAMTYQGEIFIAVIVGLGVGHLAFNVSQPIGESTDACCVEPSEPAAKVHRHHADILIEAKDATLAAAAPASGAIRLNLSPIVCEGCVASATEALLVLPGVTAVDVSLDGAAEITHAAGRDEAALVGLAVAALGKIGKTATPAV